MLDLVVVEILLYGADVSSKYYSICDAFLLHTVLSKYKMASIQSKDEELHVQLHI